MVVARNSWRPPGNQWVSKRGPPLYHSGGQLLGPYVQSRVTEYPSWTNSIRKLVSMRRLDFADGTFF